MALRRSGLNSTMHRSDLRSRHSLMRLETWTEKRTTTPCYQVATCQSAPWIQRLLFSRLLSITEMGPDSHRWNPPWLLYSQPIMTQDNSCLFLATVAKCVSRFSTEVKSLPADRGRTLVLSRLRCDFDRDLRRSLVQARLSDASLCHTTRRGFRIEPLPLTHRIDESLRSRKAQPSIRRLVRQRTEIATTLVSVSQETASRPTTQLCCLCIAQQSSWRDHRTCIPQQGLGSRHHGGKEFSFGLKAERQDTC